MNESGRFTILNIILAPIALIVLIIAFTTLTPIFSILLPLLDNTDVFLLGPATKMVLMLLPLIMAVVVIAKFVFSLEPRQRRRR